MNTDANINVAPKRVTSLKIAKGCTDSLKERDKKKYKEKMATEILAEKMWTQD